MLRFLRASSGFHPNAAVGGCALGCCFQVFGERGVHSRSAVGTNALPMNVPVEIEAIVEFDDSKGKSTKKGDDDWTTLKRP